MAEFGIAYKLTISHEGGYVNHPQDRGGESFGGVSRRYYPTWNGWLIIDRYKYAPGFPDNLKNNEALQEQLFSFYKKNFWDINKLDQLANQEIANEVFDTGVNMGYKISAEFLQTAYNLLSKNGSDYNKIVVDGLIGSKTITAINAHKYPARIVKVLNILQGSRYVQICEKDPSQEVFFAGWIERINLCPHGATSN